MTNMTKTGEPWTIAILGGWLVIGAFLPLSAKAIVWDDFIVGAIVCIVGFAMSDEKKWQGWTSGVLGIWLIIAAFLPELQTRIGNAWNASVVGILLIAAGIAAMGTGSHKLAQ